MAIKTFINGQENGVITYLDDTEPCAVYVNGERQDNISYIPTPAEGADSVSYKSEYKNNLRTLQIEGNTEQENANLFNQDEMLNNSTFTKEEYGGFDCIKAYPTSTNLIVFDLTTTIPSGSTVSVSFDVAHPNTGSNFTVSLIYEDGARLSMTAPYSTEASADYQTFVATKQVTKNVVGLGFNFSGIYANRPYYFKDIMLNIGEPVPPISIANPRAITNCGNGNIEVDVRGVNLYDISKVNGAALANTTTPDVAGHESFGTVTNGVLNLAYGVYDRGIIWTGSKIPIKQGGKYNILFDFMCENSMNGSYTYIYISFRNLTKRTSATFAIITDDNVRDVWQVKTPMKSIEIPDTWVGDNVYLQLQVAGNSNQYSKMPIYAKNIMISYNEAKPYEPYFNSTVSIPANVVLESGANETLLEFAKIGDIADTITIDRVNNEVKYTQRICRVRPFENVGGTLEYSAYDSQYSADDIWEFTLNKYAQSGIGKCEFAKVDVLTETETDFIAMIGNNGIIIGIPKSLGLNTPQALESYLMQTGKSGLSIFYVLFNPIEWTITDNMGSTVNLKTNLLEWAKNTKNQTNIIEITSTPSVSKTSVNYAKWGGVPNENNT